MGMLVLRRQEGHWTTILHAGSGQKIRFRVYGIDQGELHIAFEDEAHHFLITRDEAARRVPRDV